MTGKWDITSQYIGGKKVFQVYRLRDVNGVDHSGNREYSDRVFDDRSASQAHANELNEFEYVLDSERGSL